MSALAHWFKHAGKEVSGYDRVSTSITDGLIDAGIAVHFEDEPGLIPMQIRESKETSLIIYTPAIPKDHKEKNWFVEKGFVLFKRAEILGMISRNYPCVAIAGTHGKTSVSSMVAHLLKHSGENVTAFVGGVMKNYNSNVLIGDTESQNHLVVAEADEFDRSFLHLRPAIAVITSAEADHLDIYGKEEALKNSFREFAKGVDSKGKIFIQEKFKSDFEGITQAQILGYGLESEGIHCENMQVKEGFIEFDYVDDNLRITGLKLQIPGFHNVENALAAISIALSLGVSTSAIAQAMSIYTGVKRRFDIIVRREDIIYIDDYAHHPTEVRALLTSVRHLYPGREITAIFQPHLYTRTRDFASGFSESLSLADKVILLPIYPARELPIEGVESEMLLNEIAITDKQCLSKEQALEEVKKMNKGILLTIGAGDIDQLVPKIKAIFR